MLLSPWLFGTLYGPEAIIAIGIGAALITFGALQLSKKNR